MPSKKQGQRAQGGGRKANSEPRLQVFRDFHGVDFRQTNRFDVDSFQMKSKHDTYDDQTDLQMTYLFLQNNVDVTPTGGLETRPNIVQLFRPPNQLKFRGPVLAASNRIFAARSDYNIAYGTLTDAFDTASVNQLFDVLTKTNRRSSANSQFSSIDFYGNMLIACTLSGEVWTGSATSAADGHPFVYAIENTAAVSNPSSAPTCSPKGGGMYVSTTETTDAAFRVKVAYSYVNKFGPTKLSPAKVFYCNYPMTEWNAKRYVRMSGSIPSGANVSAVELYYATDNASFGADTSMLFLGRVDVASGATTWQFDCYGYMDATNMWPMANLLAPSENYTGGPLVGHSTHVDGRIYFYGIDGVVGSSGTEKPYRLYIGGNPGNLLSVSPGTGGGFVDVEPGTGKTIRRVLKYKTQSGNSIVTMLCSGLNTSAVERFNLVENSITMSNEQSMKSWQAEQVAGAVGCESWNGAIVCVDGLYSVNRYGLALTTMTMEYNSQIQTTYVSDAIKPVFENIVLTNASIVEIDGVIYFAPGNCNFDTDTDLVNMIFCYDIEKKAWWTHSLPNNSGYILNLFKIDNASWPEGLGIVTEYGIYYLPTAKESYDNHKYEEAANYSFLIETSQISTQMPQQGWQYLSQLEFHFDYFVGTATIEVRMIDMFGRKIVVKKSVTQSTKVYDYVVRMRIDQRTMSYVITMSGIAKFRMTHFIGRVYTLSDKVGQVWGFDDSISYRSAGDIQATIKCYNDVQRAIFT